MIKFTTNVYQTNKLLLIKDSVHYENRASDLIKPFKLKVLIVFCIAENSDLFQTGGFRKT